MVKKYIDFIKENTETFIDFAKTNLEKDYDELNRKLFNNELNNVKLAWFKNKSKLGIMISTITKNKFGKKIKEDIVGIKISTFYQLTRQQYLDVLAHEMIHVWIAQKNIKDNNAHGNRFKAMMGDINRKFKEFNIKESENANFYSVNTPYNKIKERGVLIFEHDNEMSLIATTEKNIENRIELEAFFDRLEKIVPSLFPREKNVKVTAYKVSIPAIESFKIINSFKTKNIGLFELVEDSLIQQIKSSHKLLERKIK